MTPDNPKGTIIVTGSSNCTVCASMERALAQAREAGVTVVYATDGRTASPTVLSISVPPPLKNVEFQRKQSYADRANPNQPWYAKYRKSKR